MKSKKDIELTILMPCLNEEKTLETCIKKAKTFLNKNKINGEILIADNGSTDNSITIAKKNGARVVSVENKGYGNALIAGTKNAYGKYVIMGDSDDSYDFLHLEKFVEKLREGYDLVMGNRFKGGIEKGAMPFSHQYIGNPILSFIGRLFYKSKIKDFHCGLRGYNREKMLSLNLKCGGMEYASEMVVKSELNNLKITEIPTTLSKDGRDTKPHLRTIRDGFRHLKFLIINAPNWLFLLPGSLLMLIGITGLIILSQGTFQINSTISIGVHSMLYCSGFIIIGFNLIIFFILDKLYSYKVKLINKLDKFSSLIVKIKPIIKIILCLIFLLIGFSLGISSFIEWQNKLFGELNPLEMLPKIIISNCFIILGIETIFFLTFVELIDIKLNEEN